jgi:hypothetical protein
LRLVLGSVAEQVLRQAECPVIVVRVPAAQAFATAAEDQAEFEQYR